VRRGAGVRLLLLASSLALLTSCSFPGSVPETVKIGLSAPFEGLYRDLGYEALYAVRLAVRQANDAGGIGDGRLVEMVALNDLNEPREAALQAAEMAVDPGILGVVGGLSPRTAVAAAPEYEDWGVPYMAPFADPRELGQAAARLAVDRLGARSLAIFFGEDGADLAQAEGFAETIGSLGGIVLTQAQPKVGSEIAGILARQDEVPDAVFLASETSRSAEWIAALRQAGFEGTVLGGPEVGSRLTADIAGTAGDGVYFVSPFRLGPADPAFRAGYEALSGGVAPRGVATWCYAAARDLLDAMDAVLRSGTEPWRSGTAAALAGVRPDEWVVDLYLIRGGEFLLAAEYQ